MTEKIDEATVATFLEHYGNCLGRFAIEEIADCYGLPCLILTDEGDLLVSERRQMVETFSAATDIYRQHGFASAHPRIAAFQATTATVATVDVTWDYRDAAGKKLLETDFRYLLRNNDAGEPKIRTVISINEAQRMAEFLSSRK